MGTVRSLGADGARLIKKWEGFKKDLGGGKVQSYPDPATGGAPWTIGWGSTGPDIKKGTIWTHTQAQKRFDDHVAQFSAEVAAILGKAPTTQGQFDALVSFAYNIGSDDLRTSTLMRMHKAGDYAGAAKQFARWNKAAGKVMNGLTKRRAEEAALYGSNA